MASAHAVEKDIFSLDSNWTVLQPGRYRYVVARLDGIVVRIILSEYLACEVMWYH